MPKNPSRASQGGDVEGTRPIDVTQGEACRVANASYDPGYSLKTSLSDAGTEFSEADLLQGYCEYGKAIGKRS